MSDEAFTYATLRLTKDLFARPPAALFHIDTRRETTFQRNQLKTLGSIMAVMVVHANYWLESSRSKRARLHHEKRPPTPPESCSWTIASSKLEA